MICVITRNSIPLTSTDIEVPVYQQSFSSFSWYGLRNSTYNSWKLSIFTPEEMQSMDYLFLQYCGYWNDDYGYWCFSTSKDSFPGISLYALRSNSRDDFGEIPIVQPRVDTEHLLQFSGLLRILTGTKLISYSTASTKPPYWPHQLH